MSWFAVLWWLGAGVAADAWPRHTIDAGSRGADGVRLADVDGDGRLDVVTAWEEGGEIRVCLQPAAADLRRPWPCEVVGRVGDPEDAVALDLDGDGRLEVVSSSEGDTRAMHVHRRRDAAWVTEVLPASHHRMRWMFAAQMQVDGRRGPDLVAAGKGDDAWLGWFEAPATPTDLAAWTWHPIRPVGWAMTLDVVDMNGDGRDDLLLSDRYGPRRGVSWLSRRADVGWDEHRIGGQDEQVLFVSRGDVDGDGLEDVVAAAKPRQVIVFRRLDREGRRWTRSVVTWPETAGHAKAVRVGDVDGDGLADLVITCEGATPPLEGVFYLTRAGGGDWTPRPIAGPSGVKFDLVELIDLDGDGDLDALTCEETEGLGVVWYENPG